MANTGATKVKNTSSPAFKAQGMQAVYQGSRGIPAWTKQKKKKMSKALGRNYS